MKLKIKITILLLVVILFIFIGSFQIQNNKIVNHKDILNTSVLLSDGEIIVEPEDGYKRIYDYINNAKNMVDITMYEIKDSEFEEDIVKAKNRGVKVRIILDKAYHGGETNKEAYTYFKSNNIDVKFAPGGTIYHQKTITIDNKLSIVGTGNLTIKYYNNSRDIFLVDTNKDDIDSIEKTFTNDFNSTQKTGESIENDDLLWSPKAKSKYIDYINKAQKTIDFTSEELKDKDVINTLAEALKRGVKLRIVMTYKKELANNFKSLKSLGCEISTYKNSKNNLYIHEKMLLVDNKIVVVGSQNISTSSLERNRELSLISKNPKTIKTIEDIFNNDFQKGNIN